MMESLLKQASSYAGDIDRVIMIVAVLGGIWFFIAEFVFFYLLYKYRRSASPKSEYITGEDPQHTKPIHWAHYIVIVCDIVIIVFAVKAWYTVKQTLPTPDATIKVIGQQWAWKFVHPGADGQLGTADDIETVDELHVKVNNTYHFKLESDDVIHSFSVPVFRLKQDAVPGRVITGWFKPTQTGTYDIQCAQMCGIGHGIMAARIVVESEAEHKTWMEQAKLNQAAQ